MYGIGIRIGFYLQWYTSILASRVAPRELDGLDFSNTVFITATFIALIIQRIQHQLVIVEIYIILLLCFGGYIYLVFLYAWRILTRCNPRLDPSRWPSLKKSEFYSLVNFGMLISVCCFQLWFWFSEVPHLDQDEDCQAYGFLFSKIVLNSPTFIVLNIVLQGLLLLSCVGILVIWCGKRLKLWEERRGRTLRFVSTNVSRR